MSTSLRCNGRGCEEEVGLSELAHWTIITIELNRDVFVSHYCPTCWIEVLARKAAAVSAFTKKAKKGE